MELFYCLVNRFYKNIVITFELESFANIYVQNHRIYETDLFAEIFAIFFLRPTNEIVIFILLWNFFIFYSEYMDWISIHTILLKNKFLYLFGFVCILYSLIFRFSYMKYMKVFYTITFVLFYIVLFYMFFYKHTFLRMSNLKNIVNSVLNFKEIIIDKETSSNSIKFESLRTHLETNILDVKLNY